MTGEAPTSSASVHRFGPVISLASTLLVTMTAACGGLAGTCPAPASQNPSPMVETTRAHERVPDRSPADPEGSRLEVDAGLGAPVQVFIPADLPRDAAVTLVVHFHGSAYLAEVAVARSGRADVVATVNLGAGSGAYDRAFSDPGGFDRLLGEVGATLGERIPGAPGGSRSSWPDRLVLTAFSAGHGAVRAILRDSAHFEAVDAVLLLDGLHTGYVPPRTVLDQGGALDEGNLRSVLRFARDAAASRKRLLITHSEIFPGTFASTTETADYLLERLGLERSPVLAWGPVGMQQLSDVQAGGLTLRGYAGNTAPDHVDHLHGLPEFLERLYAPNDGR